ncbi:MAG: RDD family protein [Gammaproteobacteria bacterium]|nr:RDD family protein [Gammaproteobacteria bacterium]MAY01869.1 RDD family protein [Gammaproteobacteria bacterium]
MENRHYAGFWIRFTAFMIDLVIILVCVTIPLTLIYGTRYWTEGAAFYGFWDLMFNYILPFVATIWFWQRFLGTPGKMLLKLRIVDAQTGGKPSLGQSVGRYFAYIISIIPLFLGYLWIGIDKRKQAWHDKLAGTVVIRENHKSQTGIVEA